MPKLRVQYKRKRYVFANLTEACKAFNIPVIPVRGRLRLGWKLSKALSTPLRHYKPLKYVPNPEVVAYRARKAMAKAVPSTNSVH